jgi:SAM-dependent methyltransferase
MSEIPQIGVSGEFISNNVEHAHCVVLSKFLCDSLKEKSVMDLGCGSASYLADLKKVGCKVQGYDGNPFTPQLTNGLGEVADLSKICDLGMHDWVISFEAGEHVPKEFEDNFITNLCSHAKEGIVLSWAIEGQPGEGHINCRNNDYIIEQMYNKKFICDFIKTDYLRQLTPVDWFQTNLLIFYRIDSLI